MLFVCNFISFNKKNIAFGRFGCRVGLFVSSLAYPQIIRIVHVQVSDNNGFYFGFNCQMDAKFDETVPLI